MFNNSFVILMLLWQLFHFSKTGSSQLDVSGCATICQMVTVMYPSREPTLVYVCFGKFPKKFLNEKVKRNSSFNFVILVTAILHVLSSLRYMVYKFKDQKVSAEQQKKSFSMNSYFMDKIKSESLFRYFHAFLIFIKI